MSGFVAGTFAGALVGAGIYYSFSHSIQTSTRIQRGKFHLLSESLAQSSLPSSESPYPGPLPAAARIQRDEFSSMLKARWNDDMQAVLEKVRGTSVEVKWGEIWERVKGGVANLGK